MYKEEYVHKYLAYTWMKEEHYMLFDMSVYGIERYCTKFQHEPFVIIDLAKLKDFAMAVFIYKIFHLIKG